MLSRGRKYLLSAAVSTLSVSVMLAGSPFVANATPTGDQVAAASAKLTQLEAEVSQLEEQFAQAKVAQEAAQKRANALQVDVAAQQVKVQALRQQAAVIARVSFQDSGIDATTQLFVSGDPENFLQQISTVVKVDENMNDLLQRFQAEQANLADLKRAADAEAAKADAGVKAMATATDQAKAKVGEQQAVLANLSNEQRAAALAAADTAGTDNAAAAKAVSSVPAGSQVSGGGSAIGRAAAAYALAHVGASYVWGATGPNAFDCSGLMLAAYASAGMSIDHSSIGLSRTGRPVSRDQLQPGDLIFYYSPIHHVAMYVGNGMMVHARNPRNGVVYQSVASYPAPYSGAVRLVG